MRSTTIAVTKSSDELDRRIAELTDSTGTDVDFNTWRNSLQKLPNGKYQYVKTIDIFGKSGIIKENRKSVEIPEDCTYLLKAETNFENKNVSEDVLRAIDMTISNRYAENADFQFDEIKLARFSDSDARSLFITNLEVRGITKKSQLYLNRDFFVDVEKSGIDKMCEAYFHSGWWMSRTLEDLVNHEIMHGRINHYNSFEKVNQLYQFLREDDRVKGLCKLVDKYPDEFLNEMYVAINNGQKIKKKYVDVYNEYIRYYLGGE